MIHVYANDLAADHEVALYIHGGYGIDSLDLGCITLL